MGALDVIDVFEALPARTPGVDELLCTWTRRPKGAPATARLCIEREPPECYPLLFPQRIADREQRKFHPWRALRTGVGVSVDDEDAWSLQPNVLGVRGDALLERLGDGHNEIAVLTHVATELADALAPLIDADATIYVDDDGATRAAQPFHRTERTWLVRPCSVAHIVIGFDGDVAFDVITDLFVPERSPSSYRQFEQDDDLDRERAASIARVTDLYGSFLRRFAGPRWMDVPEDAGLALALRGDIEAGTRLIEAGVAEGRQQTVEMVRALFPEEARRARDLEDTVL